MSSHLLPNIVWHSLTGPHAKYSSGTPTARRYARGFSPILGFVDPERPDFVALAPFCDIDEHIYSGGWSGAVPNGWQIDADASAHQMVWNSDVPRHDDSLNPVRLGADHVPRMIELATLTKPGPFAERTVELGEYYGLFEGERLMAMAGERMAAGPLREISGVCTHPDFQGRGLARRLGEHLVRLALARGEVPFLHVMVDNHGARRIYERMGFRHHQEIAVRVLFRVH